MNLEFIEDSSKDNLLLVCFEVLFYYILMFLALTISGGPCFLKL